MPDAAICQCGGVLKVIDTCVPSSKTVFRYLRKEFQALEIKNPDNELHVYRLRECDGCSKRFATLEQPLKPNKIAAET